MVAGEIGAAPRAPERGGDMGVMGLVGLGHGCSHFFQLVLPPLFPFLMVEFSASNFQVGALMTVFFLTSGIGQPIAGFIVDRVGARRVLFTGLAIYATAIMLVSTASSLLMIAPALMLAAIGNCVFHPADFTVLNASVRASRLGRAFGVHTFGGNLGWALAPVTMLGLEAHFGWRGALVGAGLIGYAVLGLLIVNRRLSARRARARARRRPPTGPRCRRRSASPCCSTRPSCCVSPISS